MTLSKTRIIKISDVVTTNLKSIPQIPIYYPTVDEFKDFKKFIYKLEKRGAHHMGLCKVIPPKGWVARKTGYSDMDLLIIPNPVTQSTFGADGIYIQENRPEKSVNYRNFRQFSYNDRKITPAYKDWEALEKKYWQSFQYSTPLYGANVGGTLTDESQKVWNIASLPSILSEVLREEIGGVNTPYLYFGSWQSTFGWHVEDQDLYSINYLHLGMPKHWYVIPPPFARRFERLVKRMFPNMFKDCTEFLRHKTVIICPEVLHKHGIPTRKILQEENEFMITFPLGYHSGFNTGLNIAESTNFASPRWVEYGRLARSCRCFSGTVRIDMAMFEVLCPPEAGGGHPLDLYARAERPGGEGRDLDCYRRCGGYSSEDEDTEWAEDDIGAHDLLR